MTVVFWRLCRWAAMGLILLASEALALYGVATLDRSLGLGIFRGCEFLVVAFTCSHHPFGTAIEIAFNLPLLVFVYAPMALGSLLSTGAVALHISPVIAGLIAAAMVWLALGALGLVRGLAEFVWRTRA